MNDGPSFGASEHVAGADDQGNVVDDVDRPGALQEAHLGRVARSISWFARSCSRGGGAPPATGEVEPSVLGDQAGGRATTDVPPGKLPVEGSHGMVEGK